MHVFAVLEVLNRRRFKRAALDSLEEQYGAKARARAETDLVRADRPDIIGVAVDAGLELAPANADSVAELYARRVGFTASRPTSA